MIEEESLKADSAMCLAVARAIAARDGLGTVDRFDSPDDPARTAGAPQGQKFIDLTATTAEGHELALEHTLIESHEEQLHEGRQIEKLLIPLQELLSGFLPADRSFVLSVGKGAVNDRDLDPGKVQAAVGRWVRDKATALAVGGPTTAPHHFCDGNADDLGVNVRLYAWPATLAPGGGRLAVRRGIAESEADQATARSVRFGRAFDDKLPKLLEHRPARTVLVLEDCDIATSNNWLARDAARTAAEGRDLCDTIVLVESYGGVKFGTVIYDNGVWPSDAAAGSLDWV